MKLKIIGVILTSLFLSGCASDFASMSAAQQAQWVQQNCTTQGAYNTGLNQGMTADAYIQNNFAAPCPTANQAAINAAYKRGFLEGLNHRPQEVNQTVTQKTCTNNWLC